MGIVSRSRRFELLIVELMVGDGVVLWLRRVL